jgi:hypothetical protein
MNFKRYMNEILVGLALLLMIGAYVYKNMQVSNQTEQVTEVKRSLAELKEVVALSKIWGDKKISKKVDALQRAIPAAKVKWTKKQTKVTANYSNLSSKELNTLTTKILNTPVVIRTLEILRSGEVYNVEFKCEW